MRHFLAMRWGNLVGLIGVWPAIVLLAICGILVLSQVVNAMLHGVKSVVGVYRKRVQEVDEWLADEEVEGLLNNDVYLEEKEGEKTSVKESLHPPPPYIPMKTEKSAIS